MLDLATNRSGASQPCRRTIFCVSALCISLATSGCWGRDSQDASVSSTTGVQQPGVGHQPTQGFPTGVSPATTGTPSAQNPGEITSAPNPTQSSGPGGESTASSQEGPKAPPGYPLISSCSFNESSLVPGRDGAIVLTSTDFTTGAVGWINPRTKRVHADLGLAHSDTRLKHSDRYNFLINRYGADSITILARDASLTWQGEFSVKGPEEASSNPHDLVVDAEGHLHISFLGRDHIEVWDISNPAQARLARQIDLSPFADADGLPESSLMIQCGEIYFVQIQRLNRDEGWLPVDHGYLVPVHGPSGRLYDFDGSGDKRPDGVRLLGAGMSSWRRDPRVADGTRILALNRGLQSVDLKTATVEVVIPESVFAGLGMDIWDVRNFEVSPDGRWLWILAIDGWPKHSIFRASFDQQGRDLVRVIQNVESVDASMILVDNSLWLADTTDGASGVRVFDIVGDTLRESADSPLAVGLPPYWLHLVP